MPALIWGFHCGLHSAATRGPELPSALGTRELELSGWFSGPSERGSGEWGVNAYVDPKTTLLI